MSRSDWRVRPAGESISASLVRMYLLSGRSERNLRKHFPEVSDADFALAWSAARDEIQGVLNGWPTTTRTEDPQAQRT